MPAPVPPGYTRGPILFVGDPTGTPQDDALYQWFWDEAGSYGARVLLVSAGRNGPEAFQQLHARLEAWECDWIATLHVAERATTRAPVGGAQVEHATAIALLGDNPRHIAALIGGTPLAQAIRRANARGKVVAGFGPAAAFLCQHVLWDAPRHHPATLQELVAFTPGLGLLNRVVVDTTNGERGSLRRLAVLAHNPFLVAIGLAPGSAAVLYPDETLQALGAPGVELTEGTDVTMIDVEAPATPAAVQGARTEYLRQGDGFNLDDRSLRPGDDIDLPPTSPPRTTF